MGGVGISLWALIGTTVQLPGPDRGGCDRLVHGAVVVGGGQLGRRYRGEGVGEVEAGQLGAEALLEAGGLARAVPIPGSHLQRRGGLVLHQRPALVLGEWLPNPQKRTLWREGADTALA